LHESGRDETVRRTARAGDPDRALAAAFAPREARLDLLTLCAFNVELARIAEQVSEPGLGEIRLQWWREAIERARQGEAAGQPVADALGLTLRRHALPPERIAGLIDARQFDIATKIMPDARALEIYLQDTAGAMFALAAACCGAQGSGLQRAATEAGFAFGLTGLMRALPVHAMQGRVYLPADALRSHGSSPAAVLAGSASEGLRAYLGTLRNKARAAHEEARLHVGKLGKSARAAFLPLSLVGPYLASLEALDWRGGDPLREIADINPLHRFWRMASWGP
jgi:phytoene synthase